MCGKVFRPTHSTQFRMMLAYPMLSNQRSCHWHGPEGYIPTDEEMEAMANHIREVSWPKYEALFGKETMDALKTSLGITV